MQGNVGNQVIESLVGRVRMSGKVGIDGFLHQEQMASSTAEKITSLEFWNRPTSGSFSNN